MLFLQVLDEFLGQIVDEDGVRPNLDKVQAIQDVRPPHNVDDIGRFLGMCNHPSGSP